MIILSKYLIIYGSERFNKRSLPLHSFPMTHRSMFPPKNYNAFMSLGNKGLDRCPISANISSHRLVAR